MEIKNLFKSLLGLEKHATPAKENKSSDRSVNSASEYMLNAFMHSFLTVEMIRIQGLEITLQDIRKMALVPSDKKPGQSDLVYMAVWQTLVDAAVRVKEDTDGKS